MENPFDLIMEKLELIETKVDSIQNQLDEAGNSSLKLMGTKEVADYLGFAKGTIYGLVYQRKIPVIKKGSKLFFSKQDIDKWLIKNKQLTTEELNEKANSYLIKNPLF